MSDEVSGRSSMANSVLSANSIEFHPHSLRPAIKLRTIDEIMVR